MPGTFPSVLRLLICLIVLASQWGKSYLRFTFVDPEAQGCKGYFRSLEFSTKNLTSPFKIIDVSIFIT